MCLHFLPFANDESNTREVKHDDHDVDTEISVFGIMPKNNFLINHDENNDHHDHDDVD